jgi:hypothetical protein
VNVYRAVLGSDTQLDMFWPVGVVKPRLDGDEHCSCPLHASNSKLHPRDSRSMVLPRIANLAVRRHIVRVFIREYIDPSRRSKDKSKLLCPNPSFTASCICVACHTGSGSIAIQLKTSKSNFQIPAACGSLAIVATLVNYPTKWEQLRNCFFVEHAGYQQMPILDK